jgi:hypothetical protein
MAVALLIVGRRCFVLIVIMGIFILLIQTLIRRPRVLRRIAHESIPPALNLDRWPSMKNNDDLPRLYESRSHPANGQIIAAHSRPNVAATARFVTLPW